MGTTGPRPRAAGDPPHVAFIIPFRDKGDPRRKANLETVLAHLDTLNLGTVHITGDGKDGPFNRCAAYNAGRAAHPADVYVWHEADMIVPKGQLSAGIRHATTNPGLIVPFTHYQYLSPEDTDKVNAGADVTDFTPEWAMPDGASIGAVGITSETTMQAVGQWDETFSGWGFDDNAMFHAFNVHTPTTWVDGAAWHLYHTPGWSPEVFATPHAKPVPPEEAAATEANRQRLGRYRQSTTVDEVRKLTAGAA